MSDIAETAASAAAESEPEPEGRWARFHARLLEFCKHPASILVWFCLFSLVIKEHTFSHYPMYSGWSDRTHYFYIADEEGPIKAKLVFRVSVPRMKKLYGGIRDDFRDERRKETGDKKYELTSADHAEVGRQLLAKLRDEAPAKRRKKFGEIMDRDLSLIRVEIMRQKKEFVTEKSVVVTTGPDNKLEAGPPSPTDL